MKLKETLLSLFAAALLGTLAWVWLAPAGLKDSPEITLLTIDGEELSLASLRGKPLLLTFWATSCPSCIAEMPDLARLQREYGARGLTIIGVAMPYDPPDQVVAFARDRALPFAIALDLDARLTQDFGRVQLTPTNILIDKDWRIRSRSTGRLDLDRTRQ